MIYRNIIFILLLIYIIIGFIMDVREENRQPKRLPETQTESLSI